VPHSYGAQLISYYSSAKVPNSLTELATHLQWHMDGAWNASLQAQAALANPLGP